MKTNVILLASALVCLAACNKVENSSLVKTGEINPETHEITLTVSLDGADDDTKAGYTASGSALKCTWADSDKLTLVTYDATSNSSTLQTIDNLTLSSGKGKTSATFTGTITGTPGAYYYVIYPAVTQTASEPYQSVKQGSGSIVSISQGTTYLEVGVSLFNRIMARSGKGNNLRHLDDCLMMGFGTITAGALSSVSLKNYFSILKITATLREDWAGKKLYAVRVASSTDNCFHTGITYGLRNSNSVVIVSGGNTKSGTAIGLGLGGSWDGTYTPDRYSGIEVNYDLDARQLIMYYPYFPNISTDFNSGSTLYLYGYDSSDAYMLNGDGIEIARKTLTTTVDNKRGAIYTLNF